MSINTPANRFMVSPLRIELYQHLVGSVFSLQKLGNRLVRYGEHAHAVRDTETVRKTAEALSNLPLKQYQSIGQYYLAWCERKNGAGAIKIFEQLTETAPAKYRARAMHVLSTIAARSQDSETEFRWLMESLKVFPSVEGFRGLAVLKAREGFHASALKDLEDLIPLIGSAEPLTYYDFLNSYAVELGEAGRKEEARNVSRLVLASPFIDAYPEWQETARDLKGPDRSYVAVEALPQSQFNVVPMPVIENTKSHQIRYPQPARVLNIQQWKKETGKEPDAAGDKKSLQNMTEKGMFLRAMELFSNTKIHKNKRRRMLEVIEKIAAEPEIEDNK